MGRKPSETGREGRMVGEVLLQAVCPRVGQLLQVPDRGPSGWAPCLLPCGVEAGQSPR